MIDLEEINREITRLEHADTTYANCERLSVLYSVRDKLSPEEPAEQYSFASVPTSDFISAFNGAPIDAALKLIDEHMEFIRMLYPKEYDSIIRKLQNLAE